MNPWWWLPIGMVCFGALSLLVGLLLGAMFAASGDDDWDYDRDLLDEPWSW